MFIINFILQLIKNNPILVKYLITEGLDVLLNCKKDGVDNKTTKEILKKVVKSKRNNLREEVLEEALKLLD